VAVDQASRDGEASREGPGAALYRAVFEEAPDPILLADDERRYVAGNHAARRFLGVSRETLVSTRIDDYTPSSMRAELPQIWETFLSRGSLEGVFPILLANGLERNVLFRAKANIRPGRHFSTLRVARYDAGAPRFSAGEPTAAEVTFREREVLTLLARGATVAEIASQASLSPETVRAHTRNAMRKLGAHSRPHAIALAMKRGHIDP
jgi:PAS domain S-box-containing protein